MTKKKFISIILVIAALGGCVLHPKLKERLKNLVSVELYVKE